MRKVAIFGADIFEDQRELTLFRTTDIEATYYSCKDPPELATELTDIDGLIVNLEKVTREFLSHLGQLKVIGRYGVGVDNIDLQAATEKKVAVINVPDYCIDEVAEHAVSFIFAVNRKIFTSSALARNGLWGKVKDLKPIYPIKDITLGVVGTGRRANPPFIACRHFWTNETEACHYQRIARRDYLRIGASITGSSTAPSF